MWLCATGILLPVIEHIPCAAPHPNEPHTCCLTVLITFPLTSQTCKESKDVFLVFLQLCFCVCVCVCMLSLQIGLWHSEDGLSMERMLPSINVTDTLFNTTLTITTILVRATLCSLRHISAIVLVILFAQLPAALLYVADVLWYTDNYHIKHQFCFFRFKLSPLGIRGSYAA